MQKLKQLETYRQAGGSDSILLKILFCFKMNVYTQGDSELANTVSQNIISIP